MFSLYGPQLSQELNYSSLETAFMAASANAGVYLGGPIIGYFVDRYPLKTKYFLISGGFLIFVGYYTIGLLLQHRYRLDYLLMSLIFFLIGFGSCSSYSCSLATNYRNWPTLYKSTSIGLSVSFFGLSAFVFGWVGAFLYSNEKGQLDVDRLLKFLGISCLLLNIIASFTLKPQHFDEHSRHSSMSDFLEAAPLLRDEPSYNALQTPVEIIYEHEITEYAEEREEIQQHSQHHLGIETEVLSAIGSIAQYDTPPELINRIELETITCFRSIDSYLLGLNMVVIVGVGLMFINNVGAISTKVNSHFIIAHGLFST